MEEASCVHGVADDSYAEDCHSEGIAAVARVAAKQLGDGLVVVFYQRQSCTASYLDSLDSRSMSYLTVQQYYISVSPCCNGLTEYLAYFQKVGLKTMLAADTVLPSVSLGCGRTGHPEGLLSACTHAKD